MSKSFVKESGRTGEEERDFRGSGGSRTKEEELRSIIKLVARHFLLQFVFDSVTDKQSARVLSALEAL